MPLTNAERQKRHRERLKEKANSPGLMLKTACLEWLDAVQADWRQEEDHTPEDEARIERLRKELLAQTGWDGRFAIMVEQWMEDRLRQTKTPKPAKPRRSQQAARS